MIVLTNVNRSCFNPRSRTGSDHSIGLPSRRAMRFQSTLPHGERRGFESELLTILEFQSTLPHGERHTVTPKRSSSKRCFNPRSRTGSDGIMQPKKCTYNVSIHAPARGATAPNGHQKIRNTFQSTLPHGERPLSKLTMRRRPRFQSTLPHGERPCVILIAQLNEVSIHAPARGATKLQDSSVYVSMFQSTLPHGERRNRDVGIRDLVVFQSTFPHGERPVPRKSSSSFQRFQSTLPHGERQSTRRKRAGHCSFNPRSRTGSDLRQMRLLVVIKRFQSTLPHGERLFILRN
ncbi:hypothetical protein SAMN05444162_2928 [Paenibacillaceae bacterium GAS479]|nr:hypothetical protein SAMN05444162_2928 [Paenibacillaceae bacterium GAS479]